MKGAKHEARRISRTLVISIAAAIAIVISVTFVAIWMDESNPSSQHSISRKRRHVRLLTHTNCSDMDGAVQAVQQIAEEDRGYMHSFEYKRMHPCCKIKLTAVDVQHNDFKEITVDDIVFIVKSSSVTHAKAQGILESWGKGLINLLLISDMAEDDIGSITFEEIKEMSDLDPENHARPLQMWAMKYIFTNKGNKFPSLSDKKWFVLVDDDTWVNVPALVDLARKYNYRCPVTFGYVWSHVWLENLDYMSGPAGLLMSREAFLQLSPALFTEQCPAEEYNDITFGRCCWKRKVQMVHNTGFSVNPPDRSRDRHGMVWFPPLAEAITFHYVHSEDMRRMSKYVNNRWGYTPNNDNRTYFTITRDGVAVQKHPKV